MPLRPLRVGEILDGAVNTTRAHWRTVLGIAFVVAVLAQLVSTVADGVWFRDAEGIGVFDGDTNLSSAQVSDLVGSVSVAIAVALVGTVIVTAMLTVVISRAVLGRQVTTGDAWRDSRPQVPRLFGLLLLVVLAMIAAVILCLVPGLAARAAGADTLGTSLQALGVLAGIAAMISIWVRFSLAAPALMLEKQGVITALRRSAKLVRGDWWRVCGIQLLPVALRIAVIFLVQLPMALIAALVSGDGGSISESATDTGWLPLILSGISAVIASTLVLPITAGVTTLLYLDQRIRREALDIELARAAGFSGYGSQQAGRPASGA
ncbi:DUF7544 domain-containing protein [Streptomyces boncukensis]|uniref:DUF7544 domain-containing protein n=1 Tax=Streptomyces boncukensis TaxID=2711219 RepID=UPI0030BA204C